MAFFAVEAIERAFDRTKDILMPFNLMAWTKLAVIVFFLGGTGFSSILFNVPVNTFSTYQEAGSYGSPNSVYHSGISEYIITGSQFSFPMFGVGISAMIFGFLVVSILLVMYLNSIAQFLMFRNVSEKKIRIRGNIAEHYLDAAKYLLFNISFIAIIVSLVAALFGSFMLNPVLGIVLVLPSVFVFVSLLVLSSIVHDFGLLRIIEGENGFVQSLLEVFNSVKKEWRELGVYLIFRLFISYAVGLMTAVVIGTVSLVFLLIFGVLAILLGSISGILAVMPIVVGSVLWFITILYCTVPFRTYIFSYFVEVYQGIFSQLQ